MLPTYVLSIALQIAGLTMVMLAAAHFVIARHLDWRDDLKKLSAINAQIFYAHTLVVVCGLILVGLVCLFCPQLLINRTPLAVVASACFTICWFARLVFQFVCFSGKLHNNKTIDALLRNLSTALWLYYTVVSAMLLWYQLRSF